MPFARSALPRPTAPNPRRGIAAGASAPDELTPVQRHATVAVIATVHVALGGALMHTGVAHEVVTEAAPMFVSLIAAPSPSPSPPPSPSLPTPPAAPRPVLREVAQPMIAAAPTPRPVPAVFTAPPLPDEPASPPAEAPVQAAPAAPVATALVPASPPPEPDAAPSPPPRPETAPPAPAAPVASIPASAVRYLEPPTPEYPRLARRLGEAGRVLVRVFIDETGQPRQVLLARSSGFSRLDDAALAAMRQARFRPYAENGRPTAGWATAPIDFELDPLR